MASGLLQGMPVGGSVSASALNKAAGARSRKAAVIAGLVMAVVIVAFGSAVGSLAMPALAGLLILIGVRTINPADLHSVWRTGTVQKVVLAVTFALTMVIALQYAVLVGVGLSVILHVVRQSNQVAIRRRVRDAEGHLIETDPPRQLPAGEVIVLQPYGSLFFAAAPVFEAALPAVSEASRGSVVILRLRGRSDLGTTFMDVLYRYAGRARRCRLEAGDRLGQRAHPGTARRHRDHWRDRRGERLRRRRADRGLGAARVRRRGRVGRTTFRRGPDRLNRGPLRHTPQRGSATRTHVSGSRQAPPQR